MRVLAYIAYEVVSQLLAVIIVLFLSPWILFEAIKDWITGERWIDKKDEIDREED